MVAPNNVKTNEQASPLDVVRSHILNLEANRFSVASRMLEGFVFFQQVHLFR